MKKITGLSLIICSLVAAVFIPACFLQNSDDEEYISSPTIENNSTAVYSVGFSYYSKMTYANIIRQSCSDPDFNGTITTENIGQVVPSSKASDSTAFIFPDKYTDPTLYYRYYIRYCTSGAYHTSKKSGIVQGIGTTQAKIQTSPIELKYSRNDLQKVYNLELQTATTVDTDFTELDVIISNGDIQQPFKIGVPAAATGIVSANVSINLQNSLPSVYYDTDLAIIGTIAIMQPDDINSTDVYTTYYWTSPHLVKNGDTILHIENTSEEGTVTTGDDNSGFVVPSKVNPSNILDYSRSITPEKPLLDTGTKEVMQ